MVVDLQKTGIGPQTFERDVLRPLVINTRALCLWDACGPGKVNLPSRPFS